MKNINLTQLKSYAGRLRDVRVIGLWAFAAAVLLVTWSSVGVIQTNYELQKKIAQARAAVDLQKLENSNLALRNQYYETDHYLELQARRQFGKAAPGETVLVVPRTVALSHSTDELPLVATHTDASAGKPHYQSNFEAWIDFLFRPDLENN